MESFMYPSSPIQLPTSDYYYHYIPTRDGETDEDDKQKRRKNDDNVISIGEPLGMH
jgi:hypothetical protein